MVATNKVARRVPGVTMFASMAVALSLVLVGCRMEGPPSVDLVVGVRGGFLAVVNCGAPMAEPIKIYAGEQRQEGFRDFFVAERDESCGANATVPMNPAEWDVVETATQPLLEPQTSFSISPLAESGSGVAYFVVPESGMPENEWLHPSGALSHEPCDVEE